MLRQAQHDALIPRLILCRHLAAKTAITENPRPFSVVLRLLHPFHLTQILLRSRGEPSEHFLQRSGTEDEADRETMPYTNFKNALAAKMAPPYRRILIEPGSGVRHCATSIERADLIKLIFFTLFDTELVWTCSRFA